MSADPRAVTLAESDPGARVWATDHKARDGREPLLNVALFHR